ncbi:MAG: hypothetical protein O7H41_21480 [Planctomycetota bacterium]|nr:hypothetical protein [Planctomycetota bacterium]
MILPIATGCQTTVGSYLGNRGRDLADCFTIEAGVGYGLGAELKLAGLVHIAVGTGLDGSLQAGLRYGDLVPRSETKDEKTGFFGFPIINLLWMFSDQDGYPPYLHVSKDAKEEHACYLLLPGLASYAPDRSESWIWTDPKSGWSRLHAFDIEASVYWGIIGARAGFSPGEFVDFLLGWFGVDIAGDDVPLEAGESPVEEE